MKRTLLRTWKILLTWLFVCYELGSLMDYMFFFSLNATIFMLSWVFSKIICIISAIFNVCYFVISFNFHFIKLMVYFYTPFFLDYLDFFFVLFSKEMYFILNSIELSIKIIWFDIC